MLYRIASFAGCLAFALSIGCGNDDKNVDPGVDAGVTVDGSVELDLEALYQAAVADAEVAEPDEIVDTLVAIREDNADLIRDEQDRVLMVTWTSFAGYDGIVGEETDLAVDVWVTVAPKMQAFCKASGFQGGELDLRLEQLLGLPPNNGKDRVVQLWVPAEGMFRPSPDPEIDDSVAELEFPLGTDEAHIEWFNALAASSYGENGYPWTRLGYTYDWNPDTSEVGLSEFVISRGTRVAVDSVTLTDEYCQMD